MMPYRYLYCIDMYYSTVSYYKTTGYSMSLSPFVCLHWTKSLTSDSYMYCQCTLQIQLKCARRHMPRSRSTVQRLPVIKCVVLTLLRCHDAADQSVYLDLALIDDAAVELKRPRA